MKKKEFLGYLSDSGRCLYTGGETGIYAGRGHLELSLDAGVCGGADQESDQAELLRYFYVGRVTCHRLCETAADSGDHTVACAGSRTLLGIGFSLIFPRKGKQYYVKRYHHPDGERIINEQDGSNCKCSVSFGSSIKYINSDAFERADLENNFGSLKVYFDNAIMKGTEAHVYIENNFGGVELYVPKTWAVNCKISNAFAGVDEKGHAQPDGVHTLYLHGDNSFAGVTVIYV